jgi:hypothetical protein
MSKPKQRAQASVVALGIVAVLAFSNPDGASYEQYLQNEILRDAGRQKDAARKLVEVALSRVLSSALAGVTTRTDYVLWSRYVTDLGIERIEVIGVLGNFFLVSRIGIKP